MGRLFPAPRNERSCPFPQVELECNTGESNMATTMTLDEILDDLRSAEETIHRFERRYGIASEQFYELYAAGKLDDGRHSEDFSQWAGYYRLKQRRQEALNDLSRERVSQLQTTSGSGFVSLDPQDSLVDAS